MTLPHIATHYLHTTATHTLHPPPPLLPTSTFFTLHTPTGTPHLSILLIPPHTLHSPHTQLTPLPPRPRPHPRLEINSYDPRITSWAAAHSVPVQLYYEMRFTLSAPQRVVDPRPGLRGRGYDIVEDGAWYVMREPGMRGAVESGVERVFAVVAVEGGEGAGERVAWVLVSGGGASAYVARLDTRVGWRRKGLGRALLEWVHFVQAGGGEDVDADAGVDVHRESEVWLTVLCENIGAVGLYHSLGYRITCCLWVVDIDKEEEEEQEGVEESIKE